MRKDFEVLGLEEGAWSVCFQSRFGRDEWLRPYTIDSVRELAEASMQAANSMESILFFILLVPPFISVAYKAGRGAAICLPPLCVILL